MRFRSPEVRLSGPEQAAQHQFHTWNIDAVPCMQTADVLHSGRGGNEALRNPPAAGWSSWPMTAHAVNMSIMRREAAMLQREAVKAAAAGRESANVGANVNALIHKAGKQTEMSTKSTQQSALTAPRTRNGPSMKLWSSHQQSMAAHRDTNQLRVVQHNARRLWAKYQLRLPKVPLCRSAHARRLIQHWTDRRRAAAPADGTIRTHNVYIMGVAAAPASLFSCGPPGGAGVVVSAAMDARHA